jgi:hypothetical protein
LWDDALSLLGYWRQHPPVHILLASFVGHKPPSKVSKKATSGTSGDVKEFLEMFGRDKGKT